MTRILCACCLKIEPPEGWYAIAYMNNEVDEVYCSRICLYAHTDQTCGCYDADFFEMSDENADAIG